MSELRRIEFVSDKCIIFGQTYYAGDVKSFPKAEADEYIRVGWAKDPETGEQGDRKPGSQTLNVNPVSQTVG